MVDADTTYDSIGGGNLEYRAIAQAREMLQQQDQRIRRQTFTLGKDLTQCCGGQVELLFEYFPAKNFHVVLFGVGHVAQALVKILSELSCTIQWIYSRKQMVETVRQKKWGNNATIQYGRSPEIAVDACPANSYYLVMTHSHAIDMEVVEAVLSRGDIKFCGLIGSQSKAVKFSSRLAKKQFTNEEIAKLVCPIGLNYVKENDQWKWRFLSAHSYWS